MEITFVFVAVFVLVLLLVGILDLVADQLGRTLRLGVPVDAGVPVELSLGGNDADTDAV